MLHYKKTLIYFFIVIFLSSCKFECNTNGVKKNGVSTIESTIKKVGDVIVTNSINITTNTAKLESATLVLDNGERVPDDNVVGLNENIILKLTFDNSTWKKVNNKCNVGAAEKIITSNGGVALNAGDLFKDNIEGFDEVEVIKLNAIVRKEYKSTSYYTVYFRVWDKNGNAEVTGNYKFYLKK